jgi:hypothetical protein
MAVATKTRPRGADTELTTLGGLVQTMDELSAQEQALADQQAAAERDAMQFLTDSLAVLAGGGSANATRLQAALAATGWTVSEYQADVALYGQCLAIERELVAVDREALAAEALRLRDEWQTTRLRERAVRNELARLSSMSIGRGQAITKLQQRGLLVS